MKPAFLIVFTVLSVALFSFRPSRRLPPANTGHHNATSDSAAVKWIDSFKKLREAVYRRDMAGVKKFFSFPVMNPANEIWFLVLTEKERGTKKLTGEMAPFTEKDFDKYYHKLFPKAFVKTLLKIKSAELFSKGEATSSEIKEGNTTTQMYASVDNETNVLSLNLSYRTVWKDEKGEITDGGESSVIYSFKIERNNQLQFMYVRLAG